MIRVKLAAFVLVLATAFGAGAALGAVVGPIDVGGDGDPPHQEHGRDSDEHR